MTVQKPARPVERLALLAERESAKHLTSAVLQGLEDLPQTALEKACEPLPNDVRWDALPIREMLDEAMERFDDEPTKADAWLSPRLHATLRLNRREAADSRLWNFLALRLAPDYVFWRNPPRLSKDSLVPQVNQHHFIGPFHRQTFSRLWWVAEFFRNGADYRPVEIVCRNQETFHSVLRLEIVYHRATAQAIARLMEDGTIQKTREANALFKAVNAAGSTLFFDVLAPDDHWDADAHRAWVAESAAAHVQYESLPDGPDDCHVPRSAVEALLPLFKDLFAEAPIRGKEQAEEDA